jgi:hypothetical protein
LRRLYRSYRAGDPDLTDDLFEAERRRTEALLTTAPQPPRQLLDVTAAMGLMNNMERVIATAEAYQRRAMVHQVIDRVWLSHAGIVAFKPKPAYHLFVEAVAGYLGMATSIGLEPTTFSSGG